MKSRAGSWSLGGCRSPTMSTTWNVTFRSSAIATSRCTGVAVRSSPTPVAWTRCCAISSPTPTRHTAPDGHVDISFVPDADRLRVEVRDDGEGMSPEAAARVFERFGRRDAGHRSGTGLGLPISRALVRAHGGTISVGSQLGAGTLARVTLPGYRGGLTES